VFVVIKAESPVVHTARLRGGCSNILLVYNSLVFHNVVIKAESPVVHTARLRGGCSNILLVYNSLVFHDVLLPSMRAQPSSVVSRQLSVPGRVSRHASRRVGGRDILSLFFQWEEDIMTSKYGIAPGCVLFPVYKPSHVHLKRPYSVPLITEESSRRQHECHSPK